MTEWIVTDLPEPVAPAISKWGILAKSANREDPVTPRPTLKVRGFGDFWKSSFFSIEPRPIVVLLVFGTSIPTRERPGIGASIRIDFAARARERSF